MKCIVKGFYQSENRICTTDFKQLLYWHKGLIQEIISKYIEQPISFL